MSKKKILWVVYDFVQAGGQRYVYEICKALDKEKYQIDFLKVLPMNHDKNWENEFYYQPTLQLGCRIILLQDIVNISSQVPGNRVLKKVTALKNRLHPPKENFKEKDRLLEFFNQYDYINFSGVGVFGICIRNDIQLSNSFIHVLTFSFQHENMYKDYDKSRHYNFISPITPAAMKRDLAGFINYTYQYFPLCFETNPYVIEKKSRNGIYKIAIFTRLSPMKPLDPFFYALKILIEQGVNVELDVYGSGDPNTLGLTKQLKYLYLTDRVNFMGHSTSIQETLGKNTPDLIWFQSANREPGGYAAFEISMSGLPQLFWDFLDVGESQPIEKTFPSFTELLSFAKYSKEVLLSSNLQIEIGTKQRNYAIEHYSIKDHIYILEELFDK